MNAWFELFRISNLPTIWTNIGAGAAIGFLITDGQPVTSTTAVAIVLMIIAASCLYTGGMVLNDVFDIDIDRAQRPARPLPSQRISEATAGLIGWGLLLVGIGFAAFAGMGNVLPPIVALAIAVLTVAYNGFHARTALAIVALGLCRGLLYPLGALACTGSALWDGGGSLILVLTSIAAFVHTIALSLVARSEADEKPTWPCFGAGDRDHCAGVSGRHGPCGDALVSWNRQTSLRMATARSWSRLCALYPLGLARSRPPPPHADSSARNWVYSGLDCCVLPLRCIDHLTSARAIFDLRADPPVCFFSSCT